MNKRIRTIIVDDEERARRVLENLLVKYCPDVEVVATCSLVPEAVEKIQLLKPDAVFLDIEMPEYSGFELLEQLEGVECDVVFVTAYNQYAIRAFEVSAIDYILKPISIEKLELAVNKLRKSYDHSQIENRLKLLQQNLESKTPKKLALPIQGGFEYVKLADISHINADGSYCEIYFSNGSRIIVSKKMKFFHDLLANEPNFFRCHRSHLVNINQINLYQKGTATLLMENELDVNVARDKKRELLNLLEKQNL
ncbi:MAG: response regulator [Flavobacteriales bacterium]|nr:response regulator [Flavobacteriales bacterium]